MKKIKYRWLLLLFLAFACRKSITTADLLSPFTFSSRQITADGSSIIDLQTVINKDADPALRNVLFTCSGGSFIGGTDSTITVTATYVNEKLVAVAKFQAPQVPGEVIIKAKMVLANEIHDYTQEDSIFAVSSTPDKIVMSASSFGVKINYGSEVSVTGLLTNAAGKFVSLNNIVEFTDHYDNSLPVNGRFRELDTLSNAASSVSAIYSPGNVAAGRNIWIVGTLLDSSGNKTMIKDSVLISTIPN